EGLVAVVSRFRSVFARNSGICLSTEDIPDSLLRIVAADLADRHEGSERIEQVLVECGSGKVLSEPLDRTNMPHSLSKLGLVLVGTGHLADGNGCLGLQRKNHQIVFLHAIAERPKLAKGVRDLGRRCFWV